MRVQHRHPATNGPCRPVLPTVDTETPRPATAARGRKRIVAGELEADTEQGRTVGQDSQSLWGWLFTGISKNLAVTHDAVHKQWQHLRDLGNMESWDLFTTGYYSGGDSRNPTHDITLRTQ